MCSSTKPYFQNDTHLLLIRFVEMSQAHLEPSAAKSLVKLAILGYVQSFLDQNWYIVPLWCLANVLKRLSL